MKNILIIGLSAMVMLSCKTKNVGVTSKDAQSAASSKTQLSKSVAKLHDVYVMMYTTKGNMKIKLYDETPLHRDNFVKLANEKFYDGLLFHRVINQFMIQGGDPDSRNAKPDVFLGNGGPGYDISAEFVDGLYHKKGALAAARLGDNENPQKKSSGSQFYIVQGLAYSPERLAEIERKKKITFTDQQKSTYTTLGGTPFLDKDYTVYGEVVEGLNIIDSIAMVRTGRLDRPVIDVKIDSVRVIKSKK